MNRPAETEYAPGFQSYVGQVNETDIMAVLRSEIDDLDVLLGRVPAEKETYAYAEGKWTIREIVGHLIDGERVFGYRALLDKVNVGDRVDFTIVETAKGEYLTEIKQADSATDARR